jgi:hypothetical protein
LLVRNLGGFPVEHHSWSQREVKACLADDRGCLYERAVFPTGVKVSGVMAQAVLQPGQACRDVLVFAKPSKDLAFLRLELDTLGQGGAEKLRFQIPREMLVR